MASRSAPVSSRLGLDGLYRGVEVRFCPDCGVFHFTHPLLEGEQSFLRSAAAFDAIDVLIDHGVAAYVSFLSVPPSVRSRRPQ